MKTSFVENAQKKQKENIYKSIVKVLEPGIEDADLNKVRDLPFSQENVNKALEKIEEKKRNPGYITVNKFRMDNWKTL